MGLILSLDLGTTGNRVLAFNKKGEVVSQSYYEFPQLFPEPAWVEHDPEKIWKTTQKALNDVLRDIGGQQIVGLGITNQRETTVIWNRHTGKPIYNAIVWQCRRTTERCQSLSQHADMVKEKTGLFLDPYFSATKIAWILDHVEGSRAAASRGDLAFGTIDTWILWKLTGGKQHATDVSNASRTMLFNTHTLNWDPDLLALFDIPETLLPTVYPSDHLFGYVDRTIMEGDCPIHGILGDQQAALFAHQTPGEAALKNTYGTGLFVVAHVPGERPQSDTLLSTVAWQMNGSVDYALEGSIFIGGSAIQWLRDGLEIIESAAETAELATQLESNEGVYFVPALSGLGAPHWDPDARGTLIGLTRGTTRAHIARATLESLAYQTWDVYQAIYKALPHQHFTQLGVDGGATQNTFLMQFQSDLLQLPVSEPMISEITAFGIAGVVGCALKQWTLKEFLALKTEKTRYTPQNNADTMAKNLIGWQAALKRSKGWTQHV